MNIREKRLVHEVIPDEFAHFMRDVAVKIEQGDMAAWMESDDLLQFDRGYGGLYDQAEGRYGFEYLAIDDEQSRDEGRPAICWYFDLDRQQIREIARGKLTQLPLWRCDPDCGRRFPRSDDSCDECDSLD